jgi:hypothetical protein
VVDDPLAGISIEKGGIHLQSVADVGHRVVKQATRALMLALAALRAPAPEPARHRPEVPSDQSRRAEPLVP